MQKQHRKILSSQDKEEERISTAPVTQRPKNTENCKITNFQFPPVRNKIYTRQGKRPKKQESINNQHEQIHKRPQTSKGTRGSTFHDSEYYQEDGDDLMVTSKQQKIEMFKKKVNQNNTHSKH